ncbi:MAG: HAMP domain-containing sensor histidine kinase [bacterium]
MNSDIPPRLAHEFGDAVVALAADQIGARRAREVLSRFYTEDDLQIDRKGRLTCNLPAPHEQHVGIIVRALIGQLEDSIGRKKLTQQLLRIFTDLEKLHPDGQGMASVVALLPNGYLEEERLRLLSKVDLARRVKDQTWELEKLNDELEFRVAQRTESLQKLLDEKVKTEKVLKAQSEELQKANTELRGLDQAKSDFISVVAHQLRTPLAALKWTLSLFNSGDVGEFSDEQKQYMKKMAETNDHMIKLVNDLLDANSVEAGQLSYYFGTVQVEEVIEDAVEELAAFAKTKEVALAYTKLPLQAVTADAERLHAALQNLIDNAIKYSRPGGTIAVTAEIAGLMLRVSVADQGIGIPDEQKSHVFERFFRARNAIKAENGGTGLGLFIVKKIIEDHGGTIRFVTRENSGTTFTVELPLKK